MPKGGKYKNTIDNEVVLIGKIIPGIQHLSINNQKACRLKMKINDIYSSNTIPIIFINPDEEELRKCNNKEMAIIGHIEAKWNIRVMVDAYKIGEEVKIRI